jgi:multidrug efflux pump subunit AcrA (membrane-fusion protein)
MDHEDIHSETPGLNGEIRARGAHTLRGCPTRISRAYQPASTSNAVARSWASSLRASTSETRPERPPPDRWLADMNGARAAAGSSGRIRKHWTWTQRIGGLLIAAVCVFAALWYVPPVFRSDRRLLTGTVTSSGVIALNFTDPGRIKQVNVRLGQRVRKGQVLAAEDAPETELLIASDKAAIAFDRAKDTELQAAEAADPARYTVYAAQISVGKAQLALDEARLAADRLKGASTEIVAPSSGIVVSANGVPGETATPSGVRDYVGGSQRPLPTQQPQFSLFPEGPQSVPRSPPSAYSLPVVALRTSGTWRVVVLIPEASVSRIRPDSKVLVSVPAAHIAGVPGMIDTVLPTPVPTLTGTAYQAEVTITGHARSLPLNGMAANIQVGS